MARKQHILAVLVMVSISNMPPPLIAKGISGIERTFTQHTQQRTNKNKLSHATPTAVWPSLRDAPTILVSKQTCTRTKEQQRKTMRSINECKSHFQHKTSQKKHWSRHAVKFKQLRINGHFRLIITLTLSQWRGYESERTKQTHAWLLNEPRRQRVTSDV